MSKRRSHDDRRKLEPEDVLAGRVKVGAIELLDLIHRVNPTGRELHTREEELRYAQKSRLQSLLVRRFGPELTVEADPEREDTVSIKHRGHGRDGCHAVLDALDEDARAWVRLQLDLGTAEEEAPRAVPAARPSGRGQPPPEEEREAADRDDASPESLVREAEEAVASYDYERAQARLARAVAESGGAPGPAAAFLALLVDTLGDDAGALGVRSALSRAALADPDVRALLALAAARTGDADEAVSLLRGAREAKGVEALAVLAASALASGDAEGAAAHLGEIRRRDPAHPAVTGLADEIAKMRATARGPAEAEVAALVAAGQVEEAERKAAEVLGHWPESEAARRVIRAGEERRRRAHEAAEREARELEAAREAAQVAEQVGAVRRLLAAADPREGLVAWLELEPEHRRQAEAKEAAELLRWLDQTPARAVPRARVEAVLALAAARGVLPEDPEETLTVLASHEATLERVAEARRTTQQARAAIHARRAVAARAEVEEARRDLARGDAKAALARLEAHALKDLDEAARPEAERLRAEAERIVAHDKRVADVGRLRAAGQRFDARVLAEALRDEAQGSEERARWEEERRAIQEEIQRDFRVTVDREPGPFGEEPSPNADQPMMEAPVWLTEDGRTLVLAEGAERWCWVQVVDVESRTVRARAVLRLPETLGTVIVHVLGRTAWLTCEGGCLIALNIDDFTVELFRTARELLPQGFITGSSAIVAGADGGAPRYYWVMPADRKGYGYAVRVVDLATRRVVREVEGVHRLTPIPGLPRIGCFKPNGLTLHEDRGTPEPGSRLVRSDLPIVHATVHPTRDGLIVAGKPASAAPADSVAMALLDLSVGNAARPFALEGSSSGAIMALGSSRETGVVAVTVLTLEPLWDHRLLRATGGTFEEIFHGGTPGYSTFVRDAGARHLVLYGDRPPSVIPVGAGPIALPPSSARPSPWIEHVSGAPACIGSAGVRAVSYKSIAESCQQLAPGAIAAMTRQLQRETDPEMLVDRTRALESAGAAAEEDAQRLRDWLWEHHASHPWVRLLRADERARLGLWHEVRDVLAPCTAASFGDDTDHAEHYCHLLALACVHLGDDGRAVALITEARARERGSCLQSLLGLAALLVARTTRDTPPEKIAPIMPLTELVWAIGDAGARLDAGDPEGALALLDLRRFDAGEEVQVLARRAEAWLRLDPPAGRKRMEKIMTLAALLEADTPGPGREREELPVPGATWGREKLDDVIRRAAAWLEGMDR